MKRITMFCAVVGLVALPARPLRAAEAKPSVVATLSTFGDLVRAIGDGMVTAASIASPKFNAHFIEPKPSDVLKVKRADLLVHAGLDLELWRGPLLDAAGNPRVWPGQEGELDLSRGVQLLEVPTHGVTRAEGDIHIYGNPHYWLQPNNARIMAQAISDKLCAIDPANEAAYRRNLQAWLARLDQKIPAWKAAMEPFKGRELVGYHNEWVYLMDFAGLKMEKFLEPKPGIPPTPQQVQLIEGLIRQRRIPAIVQATYYPRQTADAIAKRTGAKVVLLCQNVGELAACSDYLATMDYNINQLVNVMR